jgi:hypothetical protein
MATGLYRKILEKHNRDYFGHARARSLMRVGARARDFFCRCFQVILTFAGGLAGCEYRRGWAVLSAGGPALWQAGKVARQGRPVFRSPVSRWPHGGPGHGLPGALLPDALYVATAQQVRLSRT